MTDDEIIRLIRETPRPLPVVAANDGHLDTFHRRHSLTRRDTNRVTHEHHIYGYRRETPLFILGPVTSASISRRVTTMTLDEWDFDKGSPRWRQMCDAIRSWRLQGRPVVDVPGHIVEGTTREDSYMRLRLRRREITDQEYRDWKAALTSAVLESAKQKP